MCLLPYAKILESPSRGIQGQAPVVKMKSEVGDKKKSEVGVKKLKTVDLILDTVWLNMRSTPDS